jgi:25S rRNA (uracil2634-N3)-methyltransferase
MARKIFKQRDAIEKTKKNQRETLEMRQRRIAKQSRKHAKIPYTKEHRILLVGEGNFSFAHALVDLFQGSGGNIVATSFDDDATVAAKYDDAASLIATVQDHGATVVHGVDATKLLSHDDVNTGDGEKYDRIVFNFPHDGSGEKDTRKNVEGNQRMLHAFFLAAAPLLAEGGEVHVTLKKGKPYDQWKVGSLGALTRKLVLKTGTDFFPDMYPGYVLPSCFFLFLFFFFVYRFSFRTRTHIYIHT